MGRLVDILPKLIIVRLAIAAQKACAAAIYAVLLTAVILRVDPNAPLADTLLALVVMAGCGHTLASIALGIAIERDWATVISDGDSEALTTLNASLRRIDLLCKLASPLFVSLLTTAASYTFALAFLVGFDLLGMAFELFCAYDGTSCAHR
jgi:iron-regulated transporter 1